MDRIFLTILNMSTTVCFVILAVLVVRALLKKAPKIFSYMLWIVVLFRLICPVSFESNFGIILNNTPIQLDSEIAPRTEQTSMNKISGSSTIANVEENELYKTEEPQIASVNKNTKSNNSLLFKIAEFIWVGGIIILIGYSLSSLYQLKKTLRDAKQVDSHIYEKENLKTPFVLKVVKPNIYLPTGLLDEEKEYILAHEHMHINRKDHIVKLISFCVLIIHWMNPLVWLSFFLMTKDMEMSCDEAVLEKFGAGIKKEYSTSLLNMALEKRMITGTPLAFRKGNVKERIRNILQYKKLGKGLLLICAEIVLCAIVFFATNRTSTTDNKIQI